MIGLDANIVVRYLVQDDPVESVIANDIFERRLTDGEPGFLSVVALAEAVWVLDRTYRFETSEIVTALERLIGFKNLVIEHRPEVAKAFRMLEDGLGSFADALIGALGTSAGCSATLTFDRAAAKLPGFALP